VMLFRPSGGAFTLVDYLHIITGVWWALIVQWHLYRYLVRALRSLSGTEVPAGVSDTTA